MAPVASDMTSDSGSALGGFSYKQFDQSSAGRSVNWYNVQFYSGFVQGSIEETYESAINNSYSPKRIVLGVLDSESDGNGYVSLGDVTETISNLRSDHSNLGGVGGWEYFNAGSSDGLSRPWMWVKQISRALVGDSYKRSLTSRSRRNHTPALPDSVAKLMAEGFGQIEAARAIRLTHGDEVMARAMLSDT